MLSIRIVPCLDCNDGRVVKGIRFADLRDMGDPAALAAAYEAQGADEIVLLDVSATPEGRATAVETVRRVRSSLAIPLTVGGGVRSVVGAERLLDAGADKVAVNTAAVTRPSLIASLADRFGRQCVVVAIDAARHGRGWRVVVRSGRAATSLDAVSWAREAERRGAGEILLTSMDRDGTGDGYDLELLTAVAGAVSVPVIASGGVRHASDLVAGARSGASALLLASTLHAGHSTVAQLKSELAAASVRVRSAAGTEVPA